MRRAGEAGTERRDEDEFSREIGFHLEELTRANVARGLSPAEAARQAKVAFGGAEQVRQSLREVHTVAWVEAARANLRSAWRFIRRSPSFAATLVLTLALGIGVNSAVFSGVDAILLRPLPFPHGDELVELSQQDLAHKNPDGHVATQRLEDWNRLSSTFQAITGYYTGDASLTSGGLPEKISIAFVAPRFLEVWEVRPALGRGFTAEEESFGGPAAVLVSDRFWRGQLGGDPSAVGKPLRLGSALYRVAGVMPSSFRFPVRDVDLWEPSPVNAPYAQDRNSSWFNVIGRLKPGVTLAQARADLSTVQGQLARQYPASDGKLTVVIEPLKSVLLGGTPESLWLLYGSVSLLLLIACTNIAALLLARTAEREHEIAVRYSLGASRGAIVGQLLTEVLLLALAGSAVGLLVAAQAPRVFTLFASDLPRVEEIGLNWRVLAYSLGCAVAATLACGLVPALRGSRRTLSSSLALGSRSQVSGRHAGQWALLVVQVSLAVALLVGSGLLLRSFRALGQVAPGFDPSHVLTLRISGGWGETADMGRLTQRVERTLDGLRGVPGVEAAATSATIPGASFAYPTELRIIERGAGEAESKILADAHIVSGGYFQTLHAPLLQGAACRAGGASQVVVNRSFAERFFAGRPVLGYHLENAAWSAFTKPAEIVGVAGDMREQGLESAPQPAIYWCLSAPNPDPEYLIRTHGDPSLMANAVRQRIHALEPGRSVFEVMPLEEHLDARLAENRLRTTLLTLFAVTAVSLFSLGLYGTISYLGRTRRREVGLRLALGAVPGQIVGRFLWQGLRVTAVGCVGGLLLGGAMSHLLAGMLYSVSPLDPVTYAGVLVLTLGIALVASAVPAVRAARVDPTEILREE